MNGASFTIKALSSRESVQRMGSPLNCFPIENIGNIVEPFLESLFLQIFSLTESLSQKLLCVSMKPVREIIENRSEICWTSSGEPASERRMCEHLKAGRSFWSSEIIIWAQAFWYTHAFRIDKRPSGEMASGWIKNDWKWVCIADSAMM